MGNRATLRPNVFSTENQPENRGRPKGSKNRATLLRKWLEVKTSVTNPETKKAVKATVEDKIEIAIIAKALKGDVAAYKEIKDTLYGTHAQKHEHGGPDGGPIQQSVIFEVIGGSGADTNPDE